ncbi:hypothetical protein H4C81_22590 [Pseudomonas monteilii]|uniref:hypothetical protein n=1 Tax=Pseudomonas monteilii TaxID=76759 RepID=UPI0015FDF492|nr:hypothetical protein [Pseudomonas monteilii]MBA6091637.1 hypothetical protein [Pseudomonas monteilii]MBA6105698.1 hypothetical protein [Pseudomonas monteilii]MCT8191331.1 hypothetical protein [Pseudomonas monteilii]
MSIDIKELKRLARKVAECEDRPEIADEHAEAADALWLHMHCHTILGLIDEIERRDESPNFRAVQSARQEAEKLKVENEVLREETDKLSRRNGMLEENAKALAETHIRYTWLRKKCDEPSNDVVAVYMNIGHDWAKVTDLDRDLRTMIEQEEP